MHNIHTTYQIVYSNVNPIASVYNYVKAVRDNASK